MICAKKISLIVALACCVLIEQCYSSELSNAIKKCKGKIPDKQLKEAFKSRFANAPKNIQCFVDCMAKERKWIVANKISETAVVSSFVGKEPTANTAAIQSAVKVCVPKFAGANDCEKSTNFTKCLHEQPAIKEIFSSKSGHGSDRPKRHNRNGSRPTGNGQGRPTRPSA